MQTLGVPGAFGGGREGVQLAEYQAGSDRNRADASSRIITTRFWSSTKQPNKQLNKQFQNQLGKAIRSAAIRTKWIRSRTGSTSNYGQNQLAAAQAGLGMGQAQLGLGREQMNLSNFQRAGLGADVGALGQLGSLRQAQDTSKIKQLNNKRHRRQLMNLMEDYLSMVKALQD